MIGVHSAFLEELLSENHSLSGFERMKSWGAGDPTERSACFRPLRVGLGLSAVSVPPLFLLSGS